MPSFYRRDLVFVLVFEEEEKKSQNVTAVLTLGELSIPVGMMARVLSFFQCVTFLLVVLVGGRLYALAHGMRSVGLVVVRVVGPANKDKR